MGYRIGIYPSQTHRAAIAAAKKVLAVLKRDGDTAAIESELATFMDREDAVTARAGCNRARYRRTYEAERLSNLVRLRPAPSFEIEMIDLETERRLKHATRTRKRSAARSPSRAITRKIA